MFELPEYMTFARQMRQTLSRKQIRQGSLGNAPGKFLWYNRTHDEFRALTQGKTVGDAYARGRWLFVPLAPGYVLVFGECGGRILYHEAGAVLPQKYHLALTFEDGSALTATTQMWGAMELYETGRELDREYIRGMRPTPIDAEFTFEYFCRLVAEASSAKKRSAKALLTQDQLIPGLGNSIAQDILFHAGLHPKHDIADLDVQEKRRLYDAICATVNDIVAQGGRYDEYDLFGQRGRYVRIMDRNAVTRPCPRCRSKVVKIQYLGGACYTCCDCQT